MFRKIVDIIAVTLLVTILVVIISGYVPEQITLISYVRSNSMEPTMNVGDVFFVMPKLFAGKINIGDIVVFKYPNSPNFLVHRVVGQGKYGHLTQGDNSPFTDQQGGHPFVKEEMIIGKVVTFLGKPLLIPKLGIVLQHLSFIVTKNIFVIAIVLGTIGILSIKMDKTKRNIRKKRRLKLKFKHLYFASVLILVSITTFLMVSKTGVLEIEYLTSCEARKDDIRAVLPGSTIEREILFDNRGYIPLYVIIQPKSSNTYVPQANHLLWPGSTMRVSIQVKVNQEIGWHKEPIEVCTYLLLMPPAILETLSRLHMYIPVVIITSMLTLASALIYKAIGGGSKPITPRIGWSKWIKRNMRRIMT